MKSSEMAALRAAGLKYREIAERAGVSICTVQKKIANYTSAPPLKKTTPRKCMCCGDVFASEGPGNRMCLSCRELSLSISPYAPWATLPDLPRRSRARSMGGGRGRARAAADAAAAADE